jgi:hypothetical protein
MSNATDARILYTGIVARATVRCPTGVDALPRPGQTDRENGPKVRRELTGRSTALRAVNPDPDRVPSARLLGSELRDSERRQMPNGSVSGIEG